MGRLRRFRYDRLKEIPYAQSMDESVAERRQQLGRRRARYLDSGAARQQTAMANEMVRQMTDVWVRTWMAAISGHKPKRRR